jgi:hypothetical protein
MLQVTCFRLQGVGGQLQFVGTLKKECFFPATGNWCPVPV